MIGFFSAIRLEELSLLARRDQVVLKRYGLKHVERVFEQQLALIMQSLGLYVVYTRTGKRTVDLVCISPDPTAHASFLLEAKTSSNPYSLPAKDGRALLEYIADVKRHLTTLPPLRLVLLVAHSPASSLDRKLRALEVAAGVSIRFLSAQEIANLREKVLGPGPLAPLIDALLAAPVIIPTGFAAQVAELYRQRQGAHAELVRVLMPGAATALPEPRWREHPPGQ